MAVPKLILFDFDGVIVNTFDISYQTYTDIHPSATRDEYRELFHGNVFENKAVQEVSEETSHSNDRYFKNYTPRLLELKNDEAMNAVVRQLANETTLVIVSSAVSDSIGRYLEQHEIIDCFDKIYGSDLHRSKHVKITLALNAFSIKPEDSIMITDTLGDIREATQSQVRSIGVTWGFHDKETLKKGDPYRIVDSPAELLDTLKN